MLKEKKDSILCSNEVYQIVVVSYSCDSSVAVDFMTWYKIEECVINARGVVSAKEDESLYRKTWRTLRLE